MAVPTITAISPSGGAAAGGTTITITGTNLGTPTAVAFGAVAAASFAGVSATQAFAVSPAGTGAVFVTLTTGGGTSATGAASTFTYGAALFTVAEARAFDKLQLASATTHTDAEIIAKEAEIRAFLTKVCHVDFIPTVHTDEYQDGYDSSSLLLDWPKVTAISAASTRSGTTWTALTAAQIAALLPVAGSAYWCDDYWPAGVGNVKLTYTAGYAAVPDAIKRAALLIAVTDMPTSNVPFSAESYDAGGMNVSFAQGDGYAGAWHRIAEVRRAIRLYSHQTTGIG